jgi:hypothetical protein
MSTRRWPERIVVSVRSGRYSHHVPPFIRLLPQGGGGWEAECQACGHRYVIGGGSDSAEAVVDWVRAHVVVCSQLSLYPLDLEVD